MIVTLFWDTFPTYVSCDVSKARLTKCFPSWQEVIHSPLHLVNRLIRRFPQLINKLSTGQFANLLSSNNPRIRDQKGAGSTNPQTGVRAASNLVDHPLAHHKIRRTDSHNRRALSPFHKECGSSIYRFKAKAGEQQVAS